MPEFLTVANNSNATEVLKRGLHHVLQELFEVGEDKITAFYPDLTAGVAG